MQIVEPSVQGRKSLFPKVYVTRQIDSYLMEDLDFGERYCVPYEEDTLGKKVDCEGGHTNVYALESGLVIVVYRDYLRADYDYLVFYVRYSRTDLVNPESYAAFLRRTFEEYHIAFSGTEDEMRQFGNAPKTYTLFERIGNWYKALRKRKKSA